MGACGCGDGGPDFKLAGLGGRWIGVTIYPGCDDCETPVVVEFDHLDEFPGWVVETMPELKFNDLGVAAIEVLDAEKLREKMQTMGVDLYPDPEDPEAELIVDARDLRRVLRSAVRAKVIS